jgi:hypothetical protein
MNRIVFIALAATSAIAAAAPASAQSGGYGGYGYGNAEVRADQLQMRLQAGIRSGAITRAEAMPLRDQLRQLTRLEALYARDGISGRERADLQHRINTLRQGIRMAEQGADGRYGRDDDRYDDDRYGRDDDRYERGDDRNDRDDVDSRYDRDNDGWDDRDGNRDGRWDVDSRNDSDRDGYDDRDRDRDGRWDDEDGYRQTEDGGVVGLRVGQRASADLGGVPYAYRTRYRDGEGVYYRSDGRRIYQIDARTRTVLRVYSTDR